MDQTTEKQLVDLVKNVLEEYLKFQCKAMMIAAMSGEVKETKELKSGEKMIILQDGRVFRDKDSDRIMAIEKMEDLSYLNDKKRCLAIAINAVTLIMKPCKEKLILLDNLTQKI